MVNKYSKHLENRDTNVNTGEVWAIQDVPNTWRAKTRAKVEADGYHFLEDGTVMPNDVDEEVEA